MESLPGAHHLLQALLSRGVDSSMLGVAYLVLLGSVIVTMASFLFSRAYLVVSPNRAARSYAVYVSVVLATLLVATALENELLARPAVTLQYVAIPQLVMLMAVHLAICHRQEPWLIALGGSSVLGTIVAVSVTGLLTRQIHNAYWLTLLSLAGLLIFLWVKSISTKRGFVSAKSIYVASKESPDTEAAPQTPWLGLPQWVALVGASALLATLNAVLRGRGIAEIPAADIAIQTSALIAVTGAVAAVPAASYWLARKSWMPELTRFVWLVWIVVGFAFTYGNYLSSFNRA